MTLEERDLSNPEKIRTRFAPSPSGFLHIGAARTALFNYFFSKRFSGKFILRIEDTDIERSRLEYEKDIINSLKWLGINWDEGPDIGGLYGPYKQSQRFNIYEKYIKKLLENDLAYYCFCSEDELKGQREDQISRGEPPKYSGKCRNLSKKEIEKNIKEGKPSVIRFKTPIKKIKFKDIIRGKIEFDSNLMGDIVIAKDIRHPLFVLAGVIDDFEMKISHIIRGEDHLPNTPKQILLQEAFGFPQPKYAHLPLILGPDRTKLSKRHGAIAVSEYKKEGYLPEAIVNFISFLGWNPGNEREIYSLPSLIKEFSLDKVQKGGAIFNIRRLDFLNGFYIRRRSVEKLTEMCLPYLIESGFIEKIPNNIQAKTNESEKENHKELKLFKEKIKKFKIKETGEIIGVGKIKKIISIYQERLKKLSEISELTDFFFKDKLTYDKEFLFWKNMSEKEAKTILDKLNKLLSKIKSENFTKANLEKILIPESEKVSSQLFKNRIKDRGYLLWPLRVALSGKKASASPFEIAEILGKEKSLKRIKEARELLEKNN